MVNFAATCPWSGLGNMASPAFVPMFFVMAILRRKPNMYHAAACCSAEAQISIMYHANNSEGSRMHHKPGGSKRAVKTSQF